jgi:hypothetical protein
MNKLKVGLIIFILLGVLVSWWLSPGVIHFRQFSAADFLQQLTPLLLVALFIERSLEVFLTTWRGGTAQQLERGVEKAQELVSKNQANITDLHAAEDTLTQYRSATQRIALPAALFLGILICALGVRGLGPFLDTQAFSQLPSIQRKLFTAVDVLMTGSLVGGGSDFVHKFISIFTNFMDSTAEKAKGKP